MSAVGIWNLSIDTPAGKQYARLALSQDAHGAWEGTSHSTGSGETADLTDIKVEGNEVSWHQTITKPMKLKLKCTATIDGGKLSGKAKVGTFLAVTITGERATDA
jgi:hypothetical protein